jgi:hypothetical protein
MNPASLMTKEDWAKVGASLSMPYGLNVTLLVDGYELTLVIVTTAPLKYGICLYVDGYLKGTFITTDCEERRRFARPIHRACYKPADKAGILKELGKKRAKEYFPRLDEKFTYYSPVWPSFGPLKRHLLANNKSVEIKGASNAA